MDNPRKHGVGPFRVAVVHGGPGAAGSVEAVAQRLSERRGVLEPFQTATTLDGQVEELRRILVQHAQGLVVLIGHSWGAWLSYLVAARHPSLVCKVVMVGSGPFVEQYVPAIAANRLRRLDPAQRQEYLHLVEVLSRGIPDGDALWSRLGELTHQTDSCELIDTSDTTATDNPTLVSNPSEIYQGVWPQAAQLRRTGELLRLAAAIQCPVLAIHGDCDPSPAEGVQVPLAANLADFRMILLNQCGHEPWRERHAAERFYSILEGELAG